MNAVVVDASVALAWCFPDEGSEYAESVLVALEGRTMTVPAIWTIEIANAILIGEKQKRIRQPEILRFMVLLEKLVIVQDAQSAAKSISNVLPLAREYGLSAYDANYLELALRHGAPLATLDRRLQKAAHQTGITLLRGESN